MGIRDRSNSRGGAKVIWLVVHDTEGGGTAKALRDAAWWTGSSHAIADNLPEDQGGGLLTPAEGTVPYDRAAWTLRNGNPLSDNLELVGFASWSRAKWLSQELLLDRCARWLADRHKARPWIPLRRLSLAEIRARKPGVIGHADYSDATGDGTHWDPGPNFPWDVVIDKARAYAAGTVSEEDDVAFIVMIGRQPWLKDGLHFQAIADEVTVKSMKAKGVKVFADGEIGQRDIDRWRSVTQP